MRFNDLSRGEEFAYVYRDVNRKVYATSVRMVKLTLRSAKTFYGAKFRTTAYKEVIKLSYKDED